MRVHPQSQLQMMMLVGGAGDVAAWRQENADKGYGFSLRQVAAKRAEAAAEASTHAWTTGSVVTVREVWGPVALATPPRRAGAVRPTSSNSSWRSP